MRIHNVLHKQPKYRTIQSYPKKKTDMSGTGILAKIASYAKNLSDAYSSELGTSIRNMVPDSDENARSGFPGEKHAILKLPNGKYGMANYMGPGTQLEKRLKRGDPPRCPADAVSKAHDLRYSITTNSDDIRDADVKMVDKMGKIKDAPHNIFLGKRLIQAKMAAEDLGIMKKDAFVKKMKKRSREDSEILKTELGKMEMQGYGRKKRRKQQSGGFIFTMAAIIAALSSAASAALMGAAGAAGALVVNKIAGRGVATKLLKQTKVKQSDLSDTGKIALRKGFAYLKKNPNDIEKVLQVLAPHFKTALALKVKQKLGDKRGKGLELAGGSASIDQKIVHFAMNKLSS